MQSERKIETSEDSIQLGGILAKKGLFTYEAYKQTVYIIIDMQDRYTASKDQNLISSIKKCLEMAMKDNSYILFVINRYGPHFPSLNTELAAFIDKYTNKDTIWKEQDSAASVILDHLNSKKILFAKMFIGGVNTCACVYETIKDLSKANKDNFLIEANELCCGCLCSSTCKDDTMKKLVQYRNVIRNADPYLSFEDKILEISSIDAHLSRYSSDLEKSLKEDNLNDLMNIKRKLLLLLYNIKLNYPPNETKMLFCKKINLMLDSIPIQEPDVVFGFYNKSLLDYLKKS